MSRWADRRWQKKIERLAAGQGLALKMERRVDPANARNYVDAVWVVDASTGVVVFGGARGAKRSEADLYIFERSGKDMRAFRPAST
jgi:hypothetical protein